MLGEVGVLDCDGGGPGNRELLARAHLLGGELVGQAPRIEVPPLHGRFLVWGERDSRRCLKGGQS